MSFLVITFHLRLFLENDISEKIFIIPPKRVRHLSEISENNRIFDKNLEAQIEIADRLYGLTLALKELNNSIAYKEIESKIKTIGWLLIRNQKIIDNWEEFCESYKKDFFSFNVRGRIAKNSNHLNFINSKIPKVVLPKFSSWRYYKMDK